MVSFVTHISVLFFLFFFGSKIFDRMDRKGDDGIVVEIEKVAEMIIDISSDILVGKALELKRRKCILFLYNSQIASNFLWL